MKKLKKQKRVTWENKETDTIQIYILTKYISRKGNEEEIYYQNLYNNELVKVTKEQDNKILTEVTDSKKPTEEIIKREGRNSSTKRKIITKRITYCLLARNIDDLIHTRSLIQRKEIPKIKELLNTNDSNEGQNKTEKELIKEWFTN